MSDAQRHEAPSQDHAMDSRWIHDLRNELGTLMMATSATHHLLVAGMTAEALENLQRVQAACQRCRALLPQPQR